MKNLNSFKAFELGKAQMNAIAGGAKCSAQILLGGGDFITIDASNPDMTNDELTQGLHDKYDGLYGAGNVIVNCP